MLPTQSNQGEGVGGSAIAVFGPMAAASDNTSTGFSLRIDVHQIIRLTECRQVVARFDVEICLPANPEPRAVEGLLVQCEKNWEETVNQAFPDETVVLAWSTDAIQKGVASSVEFPAGVWRIPHAVSAALSSQADISRLLCLVQDKSQADLKNLKFSLSPADAARLKAAVCSEVINASLLCAREKASSLGRQLGPLKNADLKISIPAWGYSPDCGSSPSNGLVHAIVDGRVDFSLRPGNRKN